MKETFKCHTMLVLQIPVKTNTLSAKPPLTNVMKRDNECNGTPVPLFLALNAQVAHLRLYKL